MTKQVGFIGLGIMGGGMAGQLLDKGFRVIVWNRSSARTGPLLERGACSAGSPAELAAQADVIITMIRDDEAVRQVLCGPQGALSTVRPGTAFINMSTTTPALAHELDEAISAKGCSFLDAPVTGSKAAASSGQLGILVSGSALDIEAQRDVLTAMGVITHVGAIGSSAMLKLANNSLAAALIAAIGEAMALCRSAGLSREMLVETFVATATRVCALKKAKIINRDWSTDFALELMGKDLNQALETARRGDLSLPLIEIVREIYGQANRQGKGDLDFSVIADRD